jgi:hypothetical protein
MQRERRGRGPAPAQQQQQQQHPRVGGVAVQDFIYHRTAHFWRDIVVFGVTYCKNALRDS